MEAKISYNYYIVIDVIDGLPLYYSKMNHEWTPDKKKATGWSWAEPAEGCLKDDVGVSVHPDARVAKIKTTIEEVECTGNGKD